MKYYGAIIAVALSGCLCNMGEENRKPSTVSTETPAGVCLVIRRSFNMEKIGGGCSYDGVERHLKIESPMCEQNFLDEMVNVPVLIKRWRAAGIQSASCHHPSGSVAYVDVPLPLLMRHIAIIVLSVVKPGG